MSAAVRYRCEKWKRRGTLKNEKGENVSTKKVLCRKDAFLKHRSCSDKRSNTPAVPCEATVPIANASRQFILQHPAPNALDRSYISSFTVFRVSWWPRLPSTECWRRGSHACGFRDITSLRKEIRNEASKGYASRRLRNFSLGFVAAVKGNGPFMKSFDF